jgi:hypothetical protein
MPEPVAVFTTGELTLEIFPGWAALSQSGAQIDLSVNDLSWLREILEEVA